MLLPERKCDKCFRQDEWGCNAVDTGVDDEQGLRIWENPAVIPLVLFDEETYRCPRRPLLDDQNGWANLMFYYNLFKEGHLPDSGSIADQSFKAMNLFALMDEIVTECRDKKQEEAQAKINRS